MSDLPTTARVVIIGGGIVGVSGLYHLAQAGWTDVVLLEKNELTAGSTWHAAGNCPTFSADWAVMHMQRYSLELYRGIGAAVDYPLNYHVSGSLRLAHSKERMREFHHVAAMAAQQGQNFEILSPEEARARHPFMETHDLAGVLYDPLDGDIDPAQITQALAKGARDLGARIVRFRPATGIRRENGEWVVETAEGEIRCEIVVNAAGYYAREVGSWLEPFGGRTPPMTVLSHQYLLTDEIPEIAAWTETHGGKLPIIRDVDVSYYLRQEKSGLNLGPYERNCRVHWATADDPMPADFSFQLYPDDLERLEYYIEDAMARVPALGQVGVSKVINGPIPYTPDGLPLIGPVPGLRNAFEACCFTFGVAQGGGAGKMLAEWITQGRTEWDAWSCDPRRFTAYADQAHCDATGAQVYGHEYEMHFPHRDWPAGRNKRLSPLYDRLADLGAQFSPYNGWERADWFAKPGDDLSPEPTLTWSRHGPWEARVREEALAVRDGVGVLELCGFSRFDLSGVGAAAWLDRQICGRLPKPGRVGLGYFLDESGRVVTEMSILRRAEDHFTLITAAVAQWHDQDWLAMAAPADGSLSLTDQSAEVSTLLVTGPESRALFEKIAEADLAAPWLSHAPATVAGRPATLARVSFAGELGWEIHAAQGDMPEIHAAALEAGATPFGMWALASLRLEKVYRAWKLDLSTDYSPLELGLERFIDWSKPAFRGRDALLAERDAAPRRRFVALLVDAGDCDARPMSPVFAGRELIGEVTSGGWGWRLDASIALAMVRADLATPGTRLEIEIFGERRSAVVQPEGPLWDPANERLRA